MTATKRIGRTAFLLGSMVLTGLILRPQYVLSDEASPAKRYYAHEAVEDGHGVIAPWHQGQNGQCDFRIRVAAETMKRYPWAAADRAVRPGPHFVFNGHWQIAADGKITIPKVSKEWHNGDLGQRTATILASAVDYYRYSGDPALMALAGVAADYFLEYGLTPSDHRWPSFPVSCPTKGKHYGKSDPHGFIQLDIAAELGLGLTRVGQLTGNQRWLDAAKHWADLFAEHCNHEPGSRPWPRYANPEDVPWGTKPNGNVMTGGVAHMLEFLETLIEMGYTGENDGLLKARDAGRRYLRDELLPKWRPGIEVVCRLGRNVDAVAKSWWTEPQAEKIANTPDPELYRYGMHAPEFTAYFTVGPATYHVRIKLAETRDVEPRQRALTIEVNGREVVNGMDVAATAGGLNRAVDLVFNDVEPDHGVIAVRFKGAGDGHAAAQAVEIGPGNGGKGAKPVCLRRLEN